MVLPATNRIGLLTRDLLEKGYLSAAGRVLGVVAQSVQTGLVAQRLKELEEEAARLAERGDKLHSTNPVLRALLADLDDVLAQNARRLNNASGGVQANGVTAAGQLTKRLAGLDDDLAQRIGIVWNQPDAEAVNLLVNYVDSPAWANELRQYPQQVLDVVRNQALRGMVNGWHPSVTAEMVSQMVEGVTLSQADNLLRTLHLQSYRGGTAIHQQANAAILTKQIRVAVLDDRTCLSCIALHGTELQVGERIDDHHRGRCTSLTEVVGLPPKNIPSGVEWFNGLPENRQRVIAGHANYEALKANAVRLPDFVQPYRDDTFGNMVREASLKGLLGDGARDFYRYPSQ